VIELDNVTECGAHSATQAMLAWIPGKYINWLYEIDATSFRGKVVHTNNRPYFYHHGGIMGQMSAGWMQHMSRIAEALGMDPLEFHLANAIEKDHTALDGTAFASCGLKECLEKVAAKSGWKEKYGKLPPYRGIGVGIGAMASGSKGRYKHDTSAAFVKIADDGVVTLFTGIPDMGQGSHTTMGIIAAEVLGVKANDVRIIAGDSDITPFDPGAFTQRGTFVTGNGVKAASEDARQQLAQTAAKEFEVDPSEIIFRDGKVYPKGQPERVLPFAKVVFDTLHSTEGRYVMGRGFYNSPIPYGSMAYSFGAQVAEVEVDPETGKVTVLKVTVAHDIGRAINPLAIEGQIDGQVFSGMSQVLYEECLMEEGQPLNPSRLEYKLPRTYELPEIEYIIVETIDPHGPFGAKEVGEGPIVVTMAAVASAVANALGGMMPEIPMTPWRVLRAINQRDNP
jgi:CO/xanthine dehydrogenase Mo-binding subunit